MTEIQCISFKAKKKAYKAGIFFHGYGADASDLAPFQRLLDPAGEIDWYFPEGILEVEVGPHFMGRAWFPIDVESLQKSMMTGKPRDLSGEASSEFDVCLKTVDSFFQKMSQRYDSFFIGGFSQGGMVISHSALKIPADKIKGLAFLSTNLVDHKAMEEKLKLYAGKINFYQSHGSSDLVLGKSGARKLYDLYKKYKHQGTFEEFPGAHEIPPQVLHSLKEFYKKVMQD